MTDEIVEIEGLEGDQPQEQPKPGNIITGNSIFHSLLSVFFLAASSRIGFEVIDTANEMREEYVEDGLMGALDRESDLIKNKARDSTDSAQNIGILCFVIGSFLSGMSATLAMTGNSEKDRTP